MGKRSGEHKIARARCASRRLVALDVPPGEQSIAAAIRVAMEPPEAGEQRFALAEFSEELLPHAHAVIVAEGGGGEWACERVERLWHGTFPGPIIVVTPPVQEQIMMRGYELGAHAWKLLPPRACLFQAQLGALARRMVGEFEAPDVSLSLDAAAYCVVVDGRRVRLRPHGFALLEYLLARCEQWVRTQQIQIEVFGGHYGPESNVVRLQVLRVRHALGERSAWILEGRERFGYRVTLSKRSTAGRRGLPHSRYHGGSGHGI